MLDKGIISKIKNNRITSLDLSGYDLGDEGVKALAEMLKDNNSITSLDLSLNDIGDKGITALAKMLKVNNSITSLDLSFNRLGPKEVTALAEMLKDNNRITSLNLSDNNIGPEEVTALAKTLKNNKSITSLDLSGNNIGNEGVTALAEMLKDNNSITSLNLSYNYIGLEGVTALAEMLKDNNSITSLDLKMNNIGPEGAKALAEIQTLLERNRKLAEPLHLKCTRHILALEDEKAVKIIKNLPSNIVKRLFPPYLTSEKKQAAIDEIIEKDKPLNTNQFFNHSLPKTNTKSTSELTPESQQNEEVTTPSETHQHESEDFQEGTKPISDDSRSCCIS